MPLLLAPLAFLAVLLLVVLTLPFSVVQRYRLGTARRAARGWVAALNVCGLAISATLFLVTAAISGIWIPQAFTASASGLVAGCALGVVGLRLTRWEPASKALHYTPNRWLVLAITVSVAGRIVFSFWRAWHGWHAMAGDQGWLAASGVAGSLAAGAVVLGYYLTFWAGVWGRVREHTRRTDRRRPF